MHGGERHAHHHHHDVATADARLLWVALAITMALVAGEVVAGVLADSLALLSDAAHNVGDAGALGLALFAARLARRPPAAAFTFGWRRAEILSAQANGVTLALLGGILGYGAVQRLGDPPEVDGATVLVVGALGGVANAAAAWTLSRAQHRSLNMEGARQHVLTDLYGSVAAVAAGVAVLAWDAHRADPIAALAVVGLMLHAAVGLVRDSTRVLLEAAPRGVDPEEIGRAMSRRPGVVEIHDLHVWEVTTGFPALAAHVVVEHGRAPGDVRRDLAGMLREQFEIEHTTLQVEAQGGGLLEIEPAAR